MFISKTAITKLRNTTLNTCTSEKLKDQAEYVGSSQWLWNRGVHAAEGSEQGLDRLTPAGEMMLIHKRTTPTAQAGLCKGIKYLTTSSKTVVRHKAVTVTAHSF